MATHTWYGEPFGDPKFLFVLYANGRAALFEYNLGPGSDPADLSGSVAYREEEVEFLFGPEAGNLTDPQFHHVDNYSTAVVTHVITGVLNRDRLATLQRVVNEEWPSSYASWSSDSCADCSGPGIFVRMRGGLASEIAVNPDPSGSFQPVLAALAEVERALDRA